MTSRRSSRTYPTPAPAQDSIFSARETLTVQAALPATAEPIRRWPHPIPTATCSAPAAAACPGREETPSPAMTQALEQLQCQSQLLVDLLGAVSSLTAAVLAKTGTAGEN